MTRLSAGDDPVRYDRVIVTVSPLSPGGSFGWFADRLLAIELPELPADRRSDTVAFVCRRAQEVPTPLRIGILGLSAATGIGQRVAGDERTVRFLRRTRLPFVTELSRMVRSLGFTFVWETWPSTTPSGAAS